MQDYKQFSSVIEQIQHQLINAKHRQLLLLSGDKRWCYSQCTQLLIQLQQPCFVLSKNASLTNACWPQHMHQILGQEYPFAVYDGFSGLIPDKLAALSGIVQAGGLFILLLPDLQELENWCDPALELFQSFGQTSKHSYFNQRLKTALSADTLLHFSQQAGWINIPPINSTTGEISFTEQQNCIALIKKTAQGRANRPLLITADRGRGKSAALGIAASQLTDKKILICSMQFKALHSSFKHLATELNLAYQPSNKQLANMSFIAPDQLLNNLPVCDLLLIDEAAAIPVSILIKILNLYPRTVFSSTMIGYEGNGRGYVLKFKQYLKNNYKNMRAVTLKQPLRFAKNDPLEQHINTILALNAKHQSPTLDKRSWCFNEVQQHQLATNEALLHQIVALLALAHYQTSVNDLRHLLDATQQRLFVCQQATHIIGVCLIAIEGGFEPTLSDAVTKGTRRPQGHLMAQSLAQLSINPTLLQQRSARVVRIAIDPQHQNEKIGTQLLNYCEQQIKQQCHWFGASFGANAQLVNFWQNAGFTLIKLGFHKDKATAEHSALVVKSTSNNNEPLKQLASQFHADFSLQLLDNFNQLDVYLTANILCALTNYQNNHADKKRLKALLTTDYQLFSIKPILWRLLWSEPKSLKACEQNSQYLIIRLILQNWPLKDIQTELGINGTKTFNVLTKKAINNLYEHITHN